MQINPSSDFDSREKAAGAPHDEAAEVLSHDLLHMMESDAELERIKIAAALGFHQLDAGEFVNMTREEFLARTKQS